MKFYLFRREAMEIIEQVKEIEKKDFKIMDMTTMCLELDNVLNENWESWWEDIYNVLYEIYIPNALDVCQQFIDDCENKSKKKSEEKGISLTDARLEVINEINQEDAFLLNYVTGYVIDGDFVETYIKNG